MSLAFSDLRNSIYRKLHAKDESGSLKSAIDKAINDAYAYLLSWGEWPWAKRTGAFLLKPVLTEDDFNTLTVQAGLTTVVASTDLENYFDTGDGVDGTWALVGDYRREVASVSTTTITLALAWPTPGALSAWKLYPRYYNPSGLPLQKIYSVSLYEGTERNPLDEVNATEFLENYAYDLTVGTPTHYSIVKYTDSGNPCIAFWPLPSEAFQVTLHYYRRAVLMGASAPGGSDSDVPVMPPHYHHVLEDGAMAYLYQDFLGEVAQAARKWAVFQESLSRMAREAKPTTRSGFRLGARPGRRSDTYDNWGARYR